MFRQLTDEECKCTFFQQGSATASTTMAFIDTLREVFGNRLLLAVCGQDAT